MLSRGVPLRSLIPRSTRFRAFPTPLVGFRAECNFSTAQIQACEPPLPCAASAAKVAARRSTATASSAAAVFGSRGRRLYSTPTPPPAAAPTPHELVPVADQSVAAAPGEPPHELMPGGLDSVLQHPILIVSRELEWGNIIIGFEQTNKYSLRNLAGRIVGYIAEEEGGFGKVAGRQLLRTHRPFKATVFDVHGQKVLEIERPFYVVSTSMFIRDGDGRQLGEVHMNWHIYRRRYDLFVTRRTQAAGDAAPQQDQFAEIDGGFLELDFGVRDRDGHQLAAINKDWTGLAKTLFTDANQYLVKLGSVAPDATAGEGTSIALSPAFEAHRELSTAERAVTLATAITIDFDYFSRHSRGIGIMPIPIGGGAPPPVASPSGGDTSGTGTAPGGEVGAAAPGGGETPTGTIGGEELMRDPWAGDEQPTDRSGGWGGNDVDPDDGGSVGGSEEEGGGVLGVAWETFKEFLGDD